jgi:S-adenosylmethionine:tRNA ribosyltransferase-isomerase
MSKTAGSPMLPDPDQYHFHLPPELIAQMPAAQRSASRLLVADPRAQTLSDRQFTDLPGLLQRGDLLVCNDTRVIPARLFGRRATGGRLELFLERLLDGQRALMQLRCSKKPRAGEVLQIDGGGALRLLGRNGEFFELEAVDEALPDLLERAGHVPLPPYIRRDDGLEDRARYQTVYAREAGAVAAPTAGLHFDEALFQRLRDAGVELGFLTLHVGAGTFAPLREAQLASGELHAERYCVPQRLCEQVAAARAAGRRVIAVGTTSTRALESAFDGTQLKPGEGETRLFLYPGGRSIRLVDGLITNFHLPGSSLLMLLAAFMGIDFMHLAYAHAIAQRYRFYSYGDAMFIPARAEAGA